jgi:hypothetical protein
MDPDNDFDVCYEQLALDGIELGAAADLLQDGHGRDSQDDVEASD